MTDPSPAPDLARRARASHVVVVGGGMGGLVAALECAKVGIRVTLLEASDRLGGVLRAGELDGIVVDVGAESYATRGGRVRALVTELGLAESIVTPAASGAWVTGVPGAGAAPLPTGGLLGIPANPWAEDVRRVIGWRGAWRAYVDRIRPPLTIGHERSLGRLVRSRMGDRVLDYLVAPVTVGVYSAHPDDVDVDAAAPGLNNALTRTGSLAAAVAQLREGAPAPGSAVESLEGGMTRLVAALRDRLDELGVEIRLDTPVAALGHGDDGWTAVPTAPAGGEEFPVDPADAIVVATPEAVARALLGPHVPGLGEGEEPVRVEIVTLLLEAPGLDRAPRGTGVLTVPGSRVAKALTHSTAKWRWLAERAGGRHLVRVSFGTQGEAPATAGLDDAEAFALAREEAAAMLGVALGEADVRAAHREGYVQAQPGSAIGRAAASRAAREAIAAVDGLGAVGAWLSGTGLAQVVPDAVAEADRVRSARLWAGGSITPPDTATSPSDDRMPRAEYGATLGSQTSVTDGEETP